MKNPITVQATVSAPIDKVWQYWNNPEHITDWAFASDEWEAPSAENDLRVGGRFKTVMAAKDKSASFDFAGSYTAVIQNKLIEYDMDDKRHVKVEFDQTPQGVRIVESFEPEYKNPKEMQRTGWQTILNNFKKYVENSK
jgi:uncharacterized protein YndB with AHSA1/START domain